MQATILLPKRKAKEAAKSTSQSNKITSYFEKLPPAPETSGNEAVLKRMRDDGSVDDVEGEDDFFPRLDASAARSVFLSEVFGSERRKTVKVLHGEDNNRSRLIVDEEEDGKEEEQSASTSVEPRSGRNLRSKQNKQALSSDYVDNDQGFLTHIAATSTSSRSRSAKGKENIDPRNKSSASRISRGREDDDDDGITTTPEVPWSLFANKDSVLALGDEDSDDVHNDDDDFSPDESYGDADSSEDEFTDETEIGGIRFDTVPVIRQAGGSNQYGEMLGSAAQFGKPYPAQRDQERSTNDPSCDFGIPGTNHDRAASGKTISSSNGGIPSAFGISSASSSKGTSTATNNTPPDVKRVQKKLSGSDEARGRGDFISMRSRNKTSKKGYKGKMSDPDDDDDSTEDSSSSEDDDTPNIDQGFAINTRVFMADGSTKRIKKIQPGEYVLGPDRLPRLVVGTDAGYSPMIQVRELSQNVAHLPDDFFGLVTFSCTPKQALRLATAQHQGVHVGHDDKNRLHRVDFRKLKRVQGALIVVGSHENFRDSLPNARQEAEAFTRNRSKDVIYWTLPVDRHYLVSVAVQLQTYHLTAALDFETGRLRYHALKSGFKDEIGMLEKLAYIWGTWIGDGDSTWAKIAVNRKDKEQIARIGEVCFDLGLAAHLYELSEKEKAIGNLGGQVGITSRVHNRRNYFMIFLRRPGLGKSGAKYVPRWLRKESISVREHFLAGLIDSDGCREQQRRPFVSDSNGATSHDRDKSSQCRIYKRAPITTVYPKIAEGVFVLARSLGIPHSVSYRPAWIHGDRA
ncbi:H(+)-transporting V1 sector ATPase subunit A, partial [Podila verticillata]